MAISCSISLQIIISIMLISQSPECDIVNLPSGLGELEFPLSPETALGSWKISVQTEGEVTTKLFNVQEYGV